MNFTFAFLMLAAVPVANAQVKGGTIENGGNVIICLPAGDKPVEIVSPLPEQQPIYGWAHGDFEVLDYLRAVQSGYTPEDFVDVKDWQSEQLRLARLLGEVSPKLLISFLDFAASTRQISVRDDRASVLRRWVATKGNMIIGYDPGWAVPKRCFLNQRTSVSGVEITTSILGYMRTVTRLQTGRHVDYHYDPLWLSNVKESGYIQYSFLLTHEWLWDFTQDLNVNQTVNAFLHRRDLDTMSAAEIRDRLHALGLRF